MKIFVFLLMFFPLISGATQANYLSIHLMQPKDVILKKMDGIDGMSQYIKQVEVNINKKLSETSTLPTWGFLVIAVRNDGKIKAWIDSDVQVSPSVEKTMIDVAESTNSFSVNAGVVVFAIGFDIGNVGLPANIKPFPNDWKNVANCTNDTCQNQDIEVLVLKTWK